MEKYKKFNEWLMKKMNKNWKNREKKLKIDKNRQLIPKIAMN